MNTRVRETVRRTRALLVLVSPIMALAWFVSGACSEPPDPAAVEELTDGLWHASIGGDDFLYEFAYENETLRGLLHQVSQGKQLHEIPVPHVTLLGSAVGWSHGRFPTYSGEFDVKRDHIVGGVPGEPRFREMSLTRVDKAQWPMIRPGTATPPADRSYAWAQPEVLDNGAWQGRQVISSDWIAESTQTHIQETPHAASYAYLWWRLDPPPPQMTLGPVTFANGVGSQYISIFPDARLVIVATGGNYFNSRQSDIVDLIQRHLLQGVTTAK